MIQFKIERCDDNLGGEPYWVIYDVSNEYRPCYITDAFMGAVLDECMDEIKRLRDWLAIERSRTDKLYAELAILGR